MTKDEQQKLPLDVDASRLDEISRESGAKISVEQGIIIIEGDQADVDEAMRMINALPKIESDEDDYPYQDDPFEEIDAGQRWEENHAPYADYSVFDLLKFDEKTGEWITNQIEYHFTHNPFRYKDKTKTYNVRLTPKQILENMTKLKRR